MIIGDLMRYKCPVCGYIFDEEKVLDFCDSCHRTYIFGNGVYGGVINSFLHDERRDVDGVIVTTPSENELSVDSISFCKDDGIIVCVGEKNICGVRDLFKTKNINCRVFWPNY